MLAWTIALRELRGGIRDFRIFVSCLLIGVAVIAAVGTLSSHIENGIRREARTLMGGDVEITLTNQRASKEQIEFFEQYGKVSLHAMLRAMAIHGDHTTLVEVKGVDDNYPLLGELKLKINSDRTKAIKPGSLVAEQALYDRLEIAPGDNITLGTSRFTAADIISHEPDNIANPLTLGPRVIASVDDLQERGFLVPGSLVRYYYDVLLDTPEDADAFTQALAKQFPKAPWTVRIAGESNRSVQNFVDRLQLFMTLAGLSTLLIGGVGIMNATEAYLARKSEAIATMKTLGGSRSFVFRVYMLILLLITLLSSVIGAVAGASLSSFALPYLSDFLPILSFEFALDFGVIAMSVLFGLLTVFTFSIVPLARGVEVRPALLFRGMDMGKVRLPHRIIFANIFTGAVLIDSLMMYASDRAIAGGFIGIALISFVLFYGMSNLVKRIARQRHPKAPWAKMAVANLHRPGAHTLSIMLSIGIGLTVLISLLLVEGNFQREINETIPAEAPSLFLIDIQPSQKDALVAFLKSKDYVGELATQPMLRGRITKIKGIPAAKADIKQSARWGVDSDRGVTYSTMPPENAVLTEGAWWPEKYDGRPLVSLDRKLAAGMGLKLGDRLAVNVLGKEIEGEIANLRDVNYISFQINFSMIWTPGALAKLPATHIATVRIDNEEHTGELIRELAKKFPNVSSIRIKDSIDQVRELIGHIAFSLRLCALVTLLAGVLVLASALAATIDKRIYDTVLLKVLGARKNDILKMFFAEWLLLGTVTAAVATVLGSFGAWLILQRLDWITFHLIPGAIVLTILLALAFISLIGFVIHARIFNVRALTILRNE